MSHFKVVDENARVLSCTYDFGGGLANTFVVGLGPGELMVISPAKGLSDEAFEELAPFGSVTALVASNGFHYLGVPEWKARFPEARCYAAAGAIGRLNKKCPDVSFEPLDALQAALPSHVEVFEPPKVKLGELMAWVKTGSGWIWFVNDLVSNTPKLPKNIVLKKLFQWTRSGPGFTVNRFVWMLVAKDKQGLKQWFLERLDTHPPEQLIVGHGKHLEGADLVDRFREQLNAAY